MATKKDIYQIDMAAKKNIYQRDDAGSIATIAAGQKPNLPTLPATSTTPTTPTNTNTPATQAPKSTPTTAQTTTPTSAPTTTPTTTPTPTTAKESFSYDYDPYQKSDIVLQADALLAELMANKPGEWVDKYYDQYMGYLNQYENRDPFSYDFNSDALYNQYKDQYIQQGQMAMMDTMGQAAAMTGGYGNSYAQTVGQQAYNQQLNQLNEIMPELYQMAYERYGEEGQKLLGLYALYNGLSEQDYNKYLGELDKYYRDVDVARNNANDLYEKDYGAWYDNAKMAFDAWSIKQNQIEAEKDRQHQSEENEKSRSFTASENEKSRLASNNNNSGNEYTEVTHEDRQLMNKEISGAASTAQLTSLVNQYLNMGYDPEFINSITKDKANELMKAEEQNVVPQSVRDNRLYGANRIGMTT